MGRIKTPWEIDIGHEDMKKRPSSDSCLADNPPELLRSDACFQSERESFSNDCLNTEAQTVVYNLTDTTVAYLSKIPYSVSHGVKHRFAPFKHILISAGNQQKLSAGH